MNEYGFNAIFTIEKFLTQLKLNEGYTTYIKQYFMLIIYRYQNILLIFIKLWKIKVNSENYSKLKRYEVFDILKNIRPTKIITSEDIPIKKGFIRDLKHLMKTQN